MTMGHVCTLISVLSSFWLVLLQYNKVTAFTATTVNTLKFETSSSIHGNSYFPLCNNCHQLYHEWRRRKQCTTILGVSIESEIPTASQDFDSDDDSGKSYTDPRCTALKERILKRLAGSSASAGFDFATQFDLTTVEATIFSLLDALRHEASLGLHGTPVVLKNAEVLQALGSHLSESTTTWHNSFTLEHLQQALKDDFLDAARGSTDSNTGWTITDVSVPRGQSFEDARMTYSDVCAALEKGTVIFNAAGAHIPRLAGPSLACTDAMTLPCALNLYVTHPRKKTSAPPHTDKQDVVVVQSVGSKHWKVYSPPDANRKPLADMFARGKLTDRLPLHVVDQECELLIETTLHPGDALFIPAAFPHTTSTVDVDETSIHLTLGVDHHIWQLDYLSVRKLALQRAGVVDTGLGPLDESDNAFVGKVNQLPKELLKNLVAELPLGLLHEEVSSDLMETTTQNLMDISRSVDAETFNKVETTIWRETLERVRQQGIELLDTHRDMYLAALDEGRLRDEEATMTAHLGSATAQVLSPERIQRMSVFRVKQYYDKVNDSIQKLKDWANEGMLKAQQEVNSLPEDWAWTLPLKVGDQVEADLGGAFFPATVSRASGRTYDVNFFDGDRETNLQRNQLKLVQPPAISTDTDVDTSKMTPKQLKRWKKQQEKLKK